MPERIRDVVVLTELVMPKRRILIADDDRLICDLIAIAVRADGHEATAVQDGARALASLRARAADLLILDANMPVMDGFGVLEALRSDPMLRRIPVLMLTGLRGEKDVARARALGASSYVVKPFAIPTLLTRAYALIGPRPPALPGPTSPEIVSRIDNTEWID